MQIVLDLSVLVRFFTNDIPPQARKAEKLLEEEKDMFIPDVVFPELEYILIKKYGASRTKIVEAYKFLISKRNIQTSFIVKNASVLFEATKLDMADCITAMEAKNGVLASFDKKLIKQSGAKSFWK